MSNLKSTRPRTGSRIYWFKKNFKLFHQLNLFDSSKKLICVYNNKLTIIENLRSNTKVTDLRLINLIYSIQIRQHIVILGQGFIELKQKT